MHLSKVAVIFAARLLFAAAIVVGGALCLVAPTVAFGQATSQTIDLHPIVTPITEAIVDVVVTLIGILGLWLSLELKKKWGIDTEASVREIEANHGDALHSAVAACVTLGNGTEVHFLDTSCSAFRPITYSSHDTPETIAGVRAHNRVYDRLCPAGGAP